VIADNGVDTVGDDAIDHCRRHFVAHGDTTSRTIRSTDLEPDRIPVCGICEREDAVDYV